MSWQKHMERATEGDRHSRDYLFAAMYDELRRLARRELRRGAGITLSATTLVHEAYAALADREHLDFPDRGRFMAYMARAMRGLIVDAARERAAQKRGGDFHITRLDTHIAEGLAEPAEIVRVSEALDALAARDAVLAEVVDYRYFCGLSFAEIASIRGVSERTVQRDWEKARLLLFSQLAPNE
ncbi:MAG TPA: ECF-type sigma factor [Steroidobacteraceae bacterium]|nr:ECF-type sigma factor [Steroidobacteraceae bacterium]